MVLLVDTLRADAVSAYGSVEDTTRRIDRLAARGVRYAHAFAPSSWTLPSHVSLFTGLRVDQHGVGLWGNKIASDSNEMLAESLRRAGYETAGFSENPVVGPEFGVDQGFETFESLDGYKAVRQQRMGIDPLEEFRLVKRIARWNEARDPDKSYFLFVNIYDPHDPYLHRSENRHLPEAVGEDEAAYVARSTNVRKAICRRLPSRHEVEILHGLYLGDVAAADRKVGQILDLLSSEPAVRARKIVVTSDHGELFGEDRLLSHRFTVHHAALGVPLVVSGSVAEPGVVDEAVALRRLYHSIRCWALGDQCERALPAAGQGREEGDASPIVSIYSDEVLTLPPAVAARLRLRKGYGDDSRKACGKQDHVYGRMVSLIDYPLKLTWYSHAEPELHDLSWDPEERTELAQGTPQAEEVRSEMNRILRESGLGRDYRPDPDVREIDPKAAEALRRLGYID